MITRKIKAIAVEKLFGLYDYTLTIPSTVEDNDNTICISTEIFALPISLAILRLRRYYMNMDLSVSLEKV